MLIDTLIEPLLIESSGTGGSITTKLFPTEYFGHSELLVLYFFPGDFTSICATEVLAFHEQLDKFNQLAATPVGCSINNPYVHNAWKITPKTSGGLGTNVNHELLSDIAGHLAQKFDVLIPGRRVATRGLFVINREGKILYESRSDTKTARDVSAVLDLVGEIRKMTSLLPTKRERTASMNTE